MEVSRFREILSTAERQMNFNRIIEWDKLFACFLQKWWNDKGLAGSCCLYIWSVGTTQISVQLGASCPTEEFWPRCWSGQPVHEHLSVSRTNLCRMSPSVPCWACRWCLSHPLSESLNKFSWIFLDTKRRLRRPDKICNSRCRLWERLANKDGNTQINQQINMKPRWCPWRRSCRRWLEHLAAPPRWRLDKQSIERTAVDVTVAEVLHFGAILNWCSFGLMTVCIKRPCVLSAYTTLICVWWNQSILHFIF